MKKRSVSSRTTLTHDMKSVVMSIKAYSQLLLRKSKNSLDSDTFSYVVRLDKQVDALIELLPTYLDLSKNEHMQKPGVKNKTPNTDVS